MKLSDTTIDDFGRILKGKISITLTEYAEEASSKKATSSSSSFVRRQKGRRGWQPTKELGISSSAASIGASSSDKAARKPNNTQLTSKAR